MLIMFQSEVSGIQSNFTYHGRISRGPYIVMNLIYHAYFILLYLILHLKFYSQVIDSIPPISARTEQVLFILFNLFVLLFIFFGYLFFVFMIFQTVRRLHDVNYSGWWWPVKLFSITFLVSIPISIPVFDLLLFIVDGTHGENRYGKDPRKNTAFFRNEHGNIIEVKEDHFKTDSENVETDDE